MILSIHMRNFRGQQDCTVEFGAGQNLLKGPNEIGKTTVKHAIAFAFFGCDAIGTKNPDHLIMDGCDECEVALRTDKATFIRKKKRGAVSQVKLVRSDQPEIKMTQTELTKLLGVDFDLFASCAFAGYFMQLPDAKRREVISQAWRLDRKALLQEILGADVSHQFLKLLKFENSRLDALAVARERQMLQNQRAADAGALSQVQSQAQSDGIEAVDEQAMEAELKQLGASIQLADMYERDLRNYQQLLRNFQEREEQNLAKLEEHKRLETELAALGVQPSSLEGIDEAGVSHMRDANAIELIPMPVMPKLPVINDSEPTCSRCGQHVSTKLIESLKAERDKMIVDFNIEERRVADENQERTRQKNALISRAAELRKKQLARQEEIMRWKSRYEILTSKLQGCAITAGVMPKPPEQPVLPENVKQRYQDTQAKLQAYRMLKSRIEGNRSKIEQLTQALAVKDESIANLAKLEEALKRLPDVEVERTMANFALQDAVIKFVEGEMLVSNANGLPYMCLSDGRRMKFDVEWCKCFQRLKNGLPGFYFIDNADLVDSFKAYMPANAQVFMAKVDSSLTALQVVQL